MKTKVTLMVMAAIIVSLTLAPASTVQATAPEYLQFTADMWINGPKSAGGTFSATGIVVETNQPAAETFFMDLEEGTIHGVKTLMGVNGTVTIKFQAVFTSPVTCVGTFVIISGTGAYMKLHGIGFTEATIDPMTGHLVATYTGQGHID